MSAESLAGGRYVLERRLGRGGMAEVMLAHDTTLDRPVAVKLLSDALGDDRELRERFLREGRFAARLSHPNVVAVYDTGEEAGRQYIVMECVDGATLAEELQRRGALAPAEVVELGRQACAGLEHAHERGLVHRDVKPQNLLLGSDGTLKVADFGIARAGTGSATLTQSGTLLGTAAYMAPEVVRGEPATIAADVYSLGAVLYELLTGRPPRHATTIADLAADEPVLRPSERVRGVPPHLERAIVRALDPDPALRPASARELAHELEAPSAAPTLSQRPPEVVRRVRRTRPSHRVWLGATGAVAVIAAALALGTRDDETRAPPAVAPVPAGGTPAEDARNLANWLRRTSG
ncbi:MAG: serine/threonine-protein kinase [Gaiellaceae bacterium]